MNKKLAIIALFAFSFGAVAQDDLNLKLRHIAGIKGIDLMGGVGANCWNAELSYYKFISDVWIFRLGGNFEKTTFPSTNLTDFTVKPSINYTLFKLNDNLYVNGELGLFLGVEKNTAYSPADDLTYSYPAASNFIYGAFIGGNVEIYINTNTALIGSFQQHYIGGSDFGNWKYQLNGGLRFIFN